VKVFIVSDMEGATGVTHGDQTHAAGKDYERARRWVTKDVNAAVLGAFEAGAGLVRVSDGHGTMRNLILDEIDPRAETVLGMGLERNLCQLESLDATFGIVLCVGYHARVGTADGVLSHTWIGGVVREFVLGGKVVGETGIAAATAGAFGVPLGMVAGDAAVCREAKELLGDVETACVKTGLANRLALCLHPDATGPLIRQAAKRAVESAARRKAYKIPLPAEVIVRFSSGTLARQAAKGQGVELADPESVRIVRGTVQEALAAAWRVCYVAALELNAFPNW
jgi:D-amino peptidase